MNEPRIWTPGHTPTPKPVIDGALEDLYRRERCHERDRWKHIRDPRVEGHVRQCAVTHVATYVDANHTGTSPNTITGVVTQLGDLVLCGSYVSETGAGHPTVTSVQLNGVTAFQADVDIELATGDSRVYIHSLANVAAGTHTVVVARTALGNCTAFAMVVRGAATSAYTDGSNTWTGTGTSTTASTGARTAAAATDFWFLMVGNETALNTTMAQISPWTIPANGSVVDGATPNAVAACAYIENPGTATETGQMTLGASAAWGAVMFAYKVLSAGGTDLSVSFGSIGEPVVGGSNF